MICVNYECDRCKHNNGTVKGSYKISCDAFPNGVPGEIYREKKDSSYICNKDIHYEPNDKR